MVITSYRSVFASPFPLGTGIESRAPKITASKRALASNPLFKVKPRPDRTHQVIMRQLVMSLLRFVVRVRHKRLTVQELEKIDHLVNFFEDNWDAGTPPDIRSILPDLPNADPHVRKALLLDLVAIDNQRRWMKMREP